LNFLRLSVIELTVDKHVVDEWTETDRQPAAITNNSVDMSNPARHTIAISSLTVFSWISCVLIADYGDIRSPMCGVLQWQLHAWSSQRQFSRRIELASSSSASAPMQKLIQLKPNRSAYINYGTYSHWYNLNTVAPMMDTICNFRFVLIRQISMIYGSKLTSNF